MGPTSKGTMVEARNAPAAIGPYSHAVVANGFVYASGQIPLIPETGLLAEGIEAQTHQVLKNLTAVLEAAGSSCEGVVKTTIFLTDMAHFGVVNDVYGAYFSTMKPARSTVQVGALPKGALIEIEAVALV